MTSPAGITPEARARDEIDRQLVESGWVIQDRDEIDLSAGLGVAIREFRLKQGHGFADYLLFVQDPASGENQAVGVLEAKKVGTTLRGVEAQSQKYSEGLPDTLDAPHRPLPFRYLSTGAETQFSNHLDPDPRSRRLFQFHRPETLAEWLEMESLGDWLKSPDQPYRNADEIAEGVEGVELFGKPSTLRSRIRILPPVHIPNLWPNKIKAITNLEQSLKSDRPRALIQMATGAGKTLLAVTAVYRLIKYAGAKRVLFLVDRGNLGEQAEREFESYRTPDDNRKFTELYNVQRLQSATIGSSSKVVISTIQRLYSILKGEPFDDEADELSQFETEEAALAKEPLPVIYNSAIPPEYFDVIVIDECHRSIYSLWRQVLEYFDAYLIGLTATPAKHTFGFFNQNLVMEYSHGEAVAESVNVDFEIYNIRTRITGEGSTIETGYGAMVGIRNRPTRQVRWEQPDEDVTYGAKDLDRGVVAPDQIRLIVQTYRDRLPTEIFPGRKEVPKTLIFAKDDSHAEDIVDIVREEFGKGNEFCQKITYKTTGRKPRDLIQDFRNSYNPRIAVTVDMIATGTDIKPIEVVMFMRTVKSRVLFEQMKGRGVRVIDENELEAVTPGAKAKTRFVIVDCVGVTDAELSDTQPLERRRTVSFGALLEHVALGGTDPDMLSSLASRLARLDRQCDEPERERISEVGGGASLSAIGLSIVRALDPDEQILRARQGNDLPEGASPTQEQVQTAAKTLLRSAVEPLATKPQLRKHLIEVKKAFEQIIDHISKDELLSASYSAEAKKKANALVQSFKTFLDENRAEIDALQFFYSQPYNKRLRFNDIKVIEEAIKAPPRSWTPEKLWAAYQSIEQNKVKGASAERRLTDIVSLIRFALHQQDELVPYAQQVNDRFRHWMAQQQTAGRTFTDEQRYWLEMMRDHVAQSLEIGAEDFDLTPFVEEGGLGRAGQVFSGDLQEIIRDLNEALAA